MHKKYFIVIGIPILLLLILMVKSARGTYLIYQDSFEQFDIEKNFWSKTWWVSRQSGVDSSAALDGNYSLRVVVKPGNRRLYGKSGQATERCELLEKHRHPIGDDLWYSFSVYVPEDFPIADVRLVMGQWKQTTWTLYKKHSPVIAQRFRNGTFSVTVNNDSGQHTLFETGDGNNPALVGGWTEFVYHIRFSKEADGVLETWMNGEKIVNYEGQLAYSDDMNTSYFRLGLYRDAMQAPMTIFFDDFQLKVEGVK